MKHMTKRKTYEKNIQIDKIINKRAILIQYIYCVVDIFTVTSLNSANKTIIIRKKMNLRLIVITFTTSPEF